VGRVRRLLAVVLAAATVAVPTSALADTPAVPAPPVPAVACPDAQAPPPPRADEERPATVAPLPWPAEPVGGPLLAACGDVLPAGFAAPPQLGTAAWVLADLDTGAVLAARAPHARHRPASTLKVLTALVVIDHLEPDAVVEGTAQDADIEGSRAGIGPGGTYTVRQLLAGLLLNSGNDTANALARTLGGTPAAVAAMNATAARLGALDTRAATPSGLDGAGMSSSAYDLALLFRVALRRPLFAELTATRSIPFPGHGEQPGFTMTNSDKLLLHYPGTLGGKTGFTDAARHLFVAAAQRGGRRLVVALVRGEQVPVRMWQQAAALFDAGFALPRDVPAVGTLVETAPDGAAPSVTAAGARSPAVPGPGPQPRLPVGGFALTAVICAGTGGLLLFRRCRR